MQLLPILAVLVLSYLVGAIPFGWIIVKISTGRDVRGVESGRTGGTNAMRAAGVLAGFLTAVGDVLKGLASSWIVGWLITADSPAKIWLQVAAPLLAILGHNYSIYLLDRNAEGKLLWGGGAGGATCFGGAIGLWPWAGIIIFPIGILVYILVGYASVTTLSIGISSIAIFAYLAVAKNYPWQFVLYGVGGTLLMMWSLRPNLVRLANGTERRVDFIKRLKGEKKG